MQTDLETLAETIRAERSTMDASRRITAELARAMAGAGLFKRLVPRDFGGTEVAPADLMNELEALAAIDAAPAWVAMIGATSGLLAAYLPTEDARLIFGPDDAIVTGVFAPSGKAVIDRDRLSLDGRWKWNSGGQISTWLGGGAVLHENGVPRRTASGALDHKMILFPASEATFIDTWHTTGLRGTGSGDMAVAGVTVPASRAVSLTHDRPHIERPLYRFPLFGLLAVGIASVACGNARGALADFSVLARSRRMPNGKMMADRTATAAIFAQATADIEAARAYLQRTIEDAWRTAVSGNDLGLHHRAELRLAATHLTRTSAMSVRTLQDHAGGVAVFVDDPLNRRAADAQTMTAHMMIAPATLELAGSVLLDRAMDTSQL